MQTLAARLREGLKTIDGITLLDRGEVLGATVTFTVANTAAGDVQSSLAAQGVNVSVLEASSARLDLDARAVTEGIRASVHYYNDDSDLERLIDGVRAA